MLRTIQTQTPGATSGRILTDTRYDSRGLADETYADVYDAAAPSGTYMQAEYGEAPRLTKTGYDAAGRSVTTTFLTGGVQQWQTTNTYTGDSTATTGIPGGSAKRTITDALGRTVEERQYAGTSPTDTEFGGAAGAAHTGTRFTFTPDGKNKTIPGPDGAVWSYTYDLYGRQIAANDPDKGTTVTGYTALDQVSWTKDATGRAVISAYDVLGRVTDTWKSAVNADLTSASVLTAQKTDANKLTHSEYDTVTGGKGQPASSTRYVGGATATGSAYTQSVTAYDKQYHATGTRLTLPEGDDLVTSGALASNTLDFSSYYNVDGTLQYTNQPAAGGLAAEKVEYGYNDRGLATTLTAGGQGIVLGTTYTDLSQVSTQRLGVSEATGVMKVDVVHDYEDGTGRLLRTEVRGQAHAYDALNLFYSYDTAGNVTKISDTTTLGGTGAADHQCLDYDGYQRVTDVWTPAGGDCSATPTTAALAGAAPYWTSYTYTDGGQRATEKEHRTDGTDTTVNYCYKGGSTQPHTLLTTTSGSCTGATATYGYDAAGNTTKRPDGSATQSLAWDDEGRLAKVTEDPSGTPRTTDYVYGADGNLLIRRDAAGESVLYLGSTEVHVKAGKKWADRYYGIGESTVAMRSTQTGTAQLCWLAGDQQGTNSVAITADATQTLTKRYTTVFGESRSGGTGAWPDDKGFLGMTTDSGTGLTHLGAREYDPVIGQFLSVDPVLQAEIPQSLNGYSYAGQNPATFSDPAGTEIGSRPNSCQYDLKYCDQKTQQDVGYDPKTRTVDHTKGNQVGDGSIANGKAKTKKLPKIVYDWMTEDLNYQGTRWLTEPQYKTWLRTATEDQAKAQISFFNACLQSGSAKDCMSKAQNVKVEEEEDDHAFLSDDVADTMTVAAGVLGIASVCMGPTPAGAGVAVLAGVVGVILAADTCGADPVSLSCGAALVSMAGGGFALLKSGQLVEGATWVGSKAATAGRAIGNRARDAWRGVSGWFG